MDSVLVLNRVFLAVQVTIVRDSITALANGKARVVGPDYRPYTLEEWKQYTELYLNDPEISRQYTGLVRSPSTKLFTPQVIMFPDCEYTSPLIKTVKYSRRNIFSRDKGKCQYCENERSEFRKAIQRGTPKKSLLTLDHVIPRSKGGPSTWTNVVTACRWCNEEKGDMLLEDLSWKLASKPNRPRWQSHIGVPFNKVKKEYWERFLG